MTHVLLLFGIWDTVIVFTYLFNYLLSYLLTYLFIYHITRPCDSQVQMMIRIITKI